LFFYLSLPSNFSGCLVSLGPRRDTGKSKSPSSYSFPLKRPSCLFFLKLFSDTLSRDSSREFETFHSLLSLHVFSLLISFLFVRDFFPVELILTWPGSEMLSLTDKNAQRGCNRVPQPFGLRFFGLSHSSSFSPRSRFISPRHTVTSEV